MTFKRRAETFKAIRWDGGNFDEIGAFCPTAYGPIYRMSSGDDRSCCRVRIGSALSDDLQYLDPGDWLVRGGEEGFFVCGDADFRNDFELVGSPPRPPAKHPFEYHRPSEKQTAQITEVREGCKALYAILLTMPTSPEMTLAVRKLEECSMWANKGIILADEGPVANGS